MLKKIVIFIALTSAITLGFLWYVDAWNWIGVICFGSCALGLTLPGFIGAIRYKEDEE